MLKYTLLLAFASILLVSAKKSEEWRKCDIKVDDLNSTALYLQANVSRFVYPTTSEGFNFVGGGPIFRVACPGGTVAVRNNVTTYRSVLVECVGGQAVKITGTYIYGPLKDIGCTGTPVPISRLTGRVNSVGKKIAEIGYEIGALEFLPVVDEISVSQRGSGHVPRWVHYKLPNVINGNPPSNSELPALTNGPISGQLDYDDIYDLDRQRELLLSLFKDENVVEEYLPADGSQMLVSGQLVSDEDMYWEVEKNATFFYETSVPIWSNVTSGNWKLVGEAVRQIASQSLAEIEVWSGIYLQLYLPNASGKNVYVTLSEKVWPSQFLFKYVIDKSNNRGLVFITVNNPYLAKANDQNVICTKLASCEKEYPQFSNFSQGYTYCCSLADFKPQALKLGLPILTDKYQNIKPFLF